MGLFDSFKKRREAKRLGLSIEQVDGYKEAAEQGITLEEYKRFLSSFSEKMDLRQYSDYLRLEKQGVKKRQITRYLTKLSSVIKIEDYSDFLKAEKLGLSVEDFVAYSTTRKGKMTVQEYADFLKSEGIGSLVKCLYQIRNLKSIKEETAHKKRRKSTTRKSVKIPDTQLPEPVEEHREHDSDSKNAFTKEKADTMIAELRSRYPKGSVLPSSFEDLKSENADLALSAFSEWTQTAYGIKAEDYLVQQELISGAKPEEPAEAPADDSGSRPEKAPADPPSEIPAGILWHPGQEPENMKLRIERLRKRIDAAYPDKVIVGLYKNHKNLGEAVTEFYRLLGYPDGNSFLQAYGYTIGKGAVGRPSNNPMEVINELKRRYVNGPTCTKVSELAAENPDIAPKFKNLQNQSEKFFGMTLANYFMQEGILVGKPEDQNKGGFETLSARYKENPFSGTLLALKNANQDIDWNAVNKYYLQSGANDTFKAFLITQGILTEQKASIEDKLNEITGKLKERYPAGREFSGTIDKLKADNKDLSLSGLNSWTMQVHKESARNYLIRVGIMKTAKPAEEKPAKPVEEKPAAGTRAEGADPSQAEGENNKELFWYCGIAVKGARSVYSYISDAGELPVDSYVAVPFGPMNVLRVGVVRSCGAYTKDNAPYPVEKTKHIEREATAEEYEDQESVSSYAPVDPREAEERERKKQLAAELKAPVEPVYYDPPIYRVPEIEVTGEEAALWKYRDDVHGREGDILIEDYLGTEDHIVIPTFINGRRVSDFTSSGLRNCKASTVEIPGSIKNLADDVGSWNENIQTVIIGEGVETIGKDCFYNCKNLSSVKVSGSVMDVRYSSFRATPWSGEQKDLLIIGSVLVEMRKEHAVLNVPQGVKAIGSYVASRMESLRRVILPKSVTTLCDNAFSGYYTENIREFLFTDSLTNIGIGAFGDNKWTEKFGSKPIIVNHQLYRFNSDEKQIVIPDGVTKICNSAFSKNRNIKSVVLPESLKIIGEKAFDRCSNLTSITFSEGVETLENECFYGCRKLSSVSLPDSLNSIGDFAFINCVSLKEVTLGRSVERIGKKAFHECKMLKRVTMGESLRTIGDNAFENCEALQEADLPESVEEIGSLAFRGCFALHGVTVPRGIKKIGSAAFAGCTLTEKVWLPKAIEERAFISARGLKEIIFDPQTTVIEPVCFAKCPDITEVVIPDSVTEIGTGAFSECTGLRHVALPSGLITIGETAFWGCSAIESIVIPDTVKTIGDAAFKNCTSLSEVSMPDSFENFGKEVFTNTPYIKKAKGDYYITDGVLEKYLGDDKDVTIPDNVTAIGERAFAESYHVETIVIPDTVKTIAERMFGYVVNWEDEPMPQIKKVIIGDGVTSIGENAFANCENLTEVVFGSGLSSIGQKAFDSCKGLKEIDLSRTSLKEIAQETFNDCCNVEKIVLPDCIEIIGPGAFSGIPLETVSLPKSVKKVGRASFDDISELVVYDTIEPDACEANDPEKRSIKTELARAMQGVPQDPAEDRDNANWSGYHITVLSAETDKIRCRIFCDSKERDDYQSIMLLGWGKHAGFTFEAYDDYFMKTINLFSRAEMAFCRIQYPEGLSDAHRAVYEAYLERCMYIERSAKRIAEMIADKDAAERLEILDRYHSIDEHNIGWIRENMEKKKAKKCLAYLDKRDSR